MKVLTIADLHGPLTEEEARFIADSCSSVCLLLGDIPLRTLRNIKELLGDKPVFGVLGNHDEYGLLEKAGIENIHGKVVSFEGVSFLGLEGGPKYKNSPMSPLYTQSQMVTIANSLPKADVLVSHEGPYRLYSKEPAHCGFLGITNYIKRYRPKYVIHGHYHIEKITKKGFFDSSRVVCTYRVAEHELFIP